MLEQFDKVERELLRVLGRQQETLLQEKKRQIKLWCDLKLLGVLCLSNNPVGEPKDLREEFEGKSL